ncbi:DNA recombination protein RmuC [Anaeromyxobacter oryzae]|uniref:DNA recombination protein RmuC n=1 Tax=Anaeromyxobacter oryzae TaxID=2918170 RepID=A0ABN6N172_9BACT|nr:DNA recombination protein RmuC [Anaeromyxobacter oryzae]BDG05748.1 hypothetical protein AMOR_47440 [Anaeromyxobacter oryzae]
MTPVVVGLVTVAVVILVGAVVLLVLPGRVATATRAIAADRLDELERGLEKLDHAFRDEIARNRTEATQSGGLLRDEVRSTLKSTADSLEQRLDRFGSQLSDLSAAVALRLEEFQKTTDERLRTSHVEQTLKLDQTKDALTDAAAHLRAELTQSMKGFGDSLDRRLAETASSQGAQLGLFRAGLDQLQATTDDRLQRSHAEQTAKLDETKTALADATTHLRSELTQSMKGFGDSIDKRVADTTTAQISQLGTFGTRLDEFQKTIDERLHSSHVEQTTKLDQTRGSLADATVNLRTELTQSLKGVGDSLDKRFAETTNSQVSQFESFGARLEKLTDSNEKKLQEVRVELSGASATQRAEMAQSLKTLSTTLTEQVTAIAALLKKDMEAFSGTLLRLTDTNEKRLGDLRQTVDTKLQTIQEDNAKRLESMRQTVDEKLQGTLEKRLGESFKLVGDRLEAVQRGLGEMQTLANGVGDLKKVLANVKVRGTWGEIQLGNLLSQMLAPDQYAHNVATKPQSSERVEYAIRLPGGEDGHEVLLPIDSKFPMEDYQRLVEASERCDAAAIDDCARQLEQRIKACAQDISAKYLNPPYTTDFGILFLPTEGLYAEVVRRDGTLEVLQRDYRVVIAGPTTLAALLNSLQMGFRTLAIQKRSSEVWQVLGAVKSEFGKFGDVLKAVEKKLVEASNKIAAVNTRSRAIERQLRTVQELPAAEAEALLLPSGSDALEPLDNDVQVQPSRREPLVPA